jgi:anti-sigma-K factor RskA
VNLQEYILSGIVESYVLGLANAEETAEFERMCAAHAEVRKARETFEVLLEKQAMDHAVDPPVQLKSKIFAEIEVEKDRRPQQRRLSGPPPVIRPVWIRYVAAASVILLAVSTALNYYFFSQYKKYIVKYDELVSSQNQLAAANKTLETKLQDYEQTLNLIRDPAMAVVKMPGIPTSPSPSSLATVYWDTKSKDVYLLVNNLPEPTADKQYQLWALVDGKPVDAGVFDLKDGLSLLKMKNIPQAQAFAITLEKKGGSIAPTMEAMYVMGKVTG